MPVLASSSAMTCLQFPHGDGESSVNPLPAKEAMAIATGFSSGKFVIELERAFRSAQIPEGKAAFSTFAPRTIAPLSSLTAAPTLKFEYGA